MKEICLVANVNRSTFYAHYEKQYDLLKQIENEVIEDINQLIGGKFDVIIEETSIRPIEMIIEYVKDYRELFLVLLNPLGDLHFQQHIVDIIKRQNYDTLAQYYDGSPYTDYIFQFLSSGAVGLLIKWLYDDSELSAKQLSHLVLDLSMFGQSSFMVKKTD